MINIRKTLKTNRKNSIRNRPECIVITGFDLVSYENDIFELKVFFDTRSWDSSKVGLLHNDQIFLNELKNFFLSIHLTNGIIFNEPHLHGKNHISFEPGPFFVKKFKELYMT